MSRFADESPQPKKEPVKKDRRMDPFYVWMLVSMAVVLIITVGLTVYFLSTARPDSSEPDGTPSDTLISGTSSTEETPSQVESNPTGATSVQDTSVPDTSTESVPSSEESAASSETDPSSASETDRVAATAAFLKNRIDRETEGALTEAGSTTMILNVYDHAITEWETALNQLVNHLDRYITTGERVTEEQKRWANQTETQIEAERKKITEDSGTAKQLEIAQFSYELYRARALELFIRLYHFNPTYEI